MAYQVQRIVKIPLRRLDRILFLFEIIGKESIYLLWYRVLHYFFFLL